MDKIQTLFEYTTEKNYMLGNQNKFKQEAHGPHRSPEKTVQINKHI